MNVVKFDTIEVKCGFPRVKYPLASNPLNEFILSINKYLSLKQISGDNEILFFSSHRFSVTSCDMTLIQKSRIRNIKDPQSVAILVKGIPFSYESNKCDNARQAVQVIFNENYALSQSIKPKYYNGLFIRLFTFLQNTKKTNFCIKRYNLQTIRCHILT